MIGLVYLTKPVSSIWSTLCDINPSVPEGEIFTVLKKKSFLIKEGRKEKISYIYIYIYDRRVFDSVDDVSLS